ncbi:class I SAM-dependent methyltransferase [Niallia sp. FSL R7-0271]|uniref:class I SAM-dependent methyltransferase n=1 Tax=Niallia sp. FSL R7-0271 TaxID=2921678 RepID=UPI0030F8AA34
MPESKRAKSWEDPSVNSYATTIRKKIAGYPLLYELTGNLMEGFLIGDSNHTVLIVGAGGGQELVTFSNNSLWSYVAVDSSEEMLKLAKSRTKNIADRICFHHSEWDMFSTEKQFDGATCLLVLHFIKGLGNKRKFLLNIAKHLKPGAPLLLAAIQGEQVSESFEMQMAGWRNYMISNGISPEEFAEFAATIGQGTEVNSDEEWKELLYDCGFTNVSCYFGSFLIRGFICTRDKAQAT